MKFKFFKYCAVLIFILAFFVFSSASLVSAQAVGQEYPGRLVITTVSPDPVNATATVSGYGEGGSWRRGRVHCADGTDSYGLFVMRLATSTPPTTSIQPYATHTMPSYTPIYSIDGAANSGSYQLTWDGNQGMNAPISCDTAIGEIEPVGYGFNFSVNTSALSNGTHTIKVSAYDESTGATIYSDSKSFTVSHPVAAIPTVTTTAMTAITQTTATTGGNITSNGGATVTTSGILWGTTSDLEYCDPTPTARCSDGQTIGATAMGPWTNNITGLTAGTTYYVRAYAKNSVGVGYGAVVQGTTTSNTGPSGTLTATDCVIPANASTCSDTNATWTTANRIPTARTEVTHNNPDTTSVSTATSGTNVDSTVNYGNTTFYLYHNAAILAQTTITASCAVGTVWTTGETGGDKGGGGVSGDNLLDKGAGDEGAGRAGDTQATGGSCVPVVGMYGTLTATPTSCTINDGANSCNVTLSWHVYLPESPLSNITSDTNDDGDPSPNTIITSPAPGTHQGTKSYTFTHPYTKKFFLNNNGKSLVPTSEAPNGSGITVAARCRPGSSFDSERNQCVRIIIGQTCENGGTWPNCNEGGPTGPGVCATTHYNCSAGTSSTPLSSPTRWTWKCLGSDNNTSTDDVSCIEKKSPGYIEH